MNKGEILWFEDNKNFVRTRREFLEEAGFSLTVITSLAEANDLFGRLSSGEETGLKKVDLALVDGVLPRGENPDYLDEYAGQAIVGLFKQHFPGIPVIGAAFDKDVDGADFQVHKRQGVTALLELIESL